MMSNSILHRELEIFVSDRQLQDYTAAVLDLPIAEDQLANAELQITLREIIKDVFNEITPLVDSVQALSHSSEEAKNPEYYLLKGLRFHELGYSQEKDVRGSFIVGLSSFWGQPALGNYHEPDAHYAYRHVKSRPRLAEEPLTLLNSTREGFPHTDSAFKHEPEPLFALFMARAAKDGGDSLLWSTASLTEWISNQPNGKEALELMRTKLMPFVGSVLTPEKVIHAPILINNRLDKMRYKRDAIEDGAKALSRSLTSEEHFILDMLDSATKNPELNVRFSMADGDAVVLDNHRTLHSRSYFEDHNRHVLKTTIYDEFNVNQQIGQAI